MPATFVRRDVDVDVVSRVQPMITGGVKVKINVLEEQVFGPLVLFGR